MFTKTKEIESMNRNSNTRKHAFTPLAMFIVVSFLCGCAAPTVYTDLMPETLTTNPSIQKMMGSISIRTSVPAKTTNPTFKSMDVSEWIDSKKLKEAIEKTISQQGMFSEISQGKADYILDVWVDKVQNMLEITGEGFIFDLTSIWRLTRTGDGKVIVCEFVKGHGASGGFADRAYPPSISAATRDMLKKGLDAISDQAQSHLSALSTAEHRAGISPGN
jgi:hypothetical protein